MQRSLRNLSFSSLLLLLALTISTTLPSLAAENPSPQPTYTPKATYTPQGAIPTATPTAFPTSTPYGGISHSTENTLSETFDILSSLPEKNNFLGNYSISEPHQDERERLEGVAGYCIDIGDNPTGEWFGVTCFYKDMQTELSAADRLRVLWQPTGNQVFVSDAPVLGQGARIYKRTGSQGDIGEYSGGFIYGNWTALFTFPLWENKEILPEIEKTINAILQEFPKPDREPPISTQEENAAANLFQDFHGYSPEDIFTNIFSDDELPANLTMSPYQENQNGYHGEFKLYYGPEHEEEGEILIWDADPGSSLLDKNLHPLPIEAPNVGDYSFMSYTGRDDPNEFNITYFVQKNNFYIALTLENRGDETQAALVQLAEAIIEDIPQAPFIDLPTNGDFTEQQFMSCFPKQSALGFEQPMYQYFWDTHRTRHGFKYSTSYYTFGNPPSFAFNHLDINMVVNLVSFGGQNIGMNQISTPIPSINERAFAHIREPMYANLTPIYENQLTFQKGPVIITFNIASSVYDPSILDQMVVLAQQVSDCLPKDPILPKDISPPSDPQGEEINSPYVSIRDMIYTEDSPQADISNLPVIDKGHWGEQIGLIFDYSKEVTAPFTAMIYSTKYDVYSARWQVHNTEGEGEHQVFVEPDRESVELGEHIFYVWMGDELIISYPFYIGHWEGKEE